MSAENMSRVRSLLPAMKLAWDVESAVLMSDHLHVTLRQNHAGDIPHLLHSIPIQITVLDTEAESEAA